MSTAPSTRIAAAIGAVLLLGACTQNDETAPAETAVAVASECEAPPAADVTTPEGWIGYLAEHPDSVAVAIDDGTGNTVEHRADSPQPLASAVKVVHLAAYAQAVDAGRLDPNERVPVSEWERWYLPDTDGFAHPRALERLGVDDPTDTVTLDEIVSAMIQESDNAAPDYLADRLGGDALRAAATQGGWDDFEPPTMLGNALAMFDPTLDDREAVHAAARRYADDPDYRTGFAAANYGDDLFADIGRIQEFGNTGTAADLASLHRSIADGSFGPGSEIARAHLEWQPVPDGFDGVGFKGGSLPGILTEAMTFRREDGTVSTAVLLANRMSEDDYTAAFQSLPYQGLLVAAANDRDTLERIRCAL